MARYGDRIEQVFHPAQPDPNCQCGFTRCDRESSYCEISRLAERAVVSSKAEGGPGLSESDALLAAFDQMAEFHRAEAKRRSEGGVGSATADTPGQPGSGAVGVTAPPVSPRKKRRTKQEMEAARAAKARAIESSYREQIPAGHWLDEPDESMDSLMEELRRDA